MPSAMWQEGKTGSKEMLQRAFLGERSSVVDEVQTQNQQILCKNGSTLNLSLVPYLLRADNIHFAESS